MLVKLFLYHISLLKSWLKKEKTELSNFNQFVIYVA